MRAYQITLYSGSAMPDPSYKNVYWYPDVGTDPTDLFDGTNNQRPKQFFEYSLGVQRYTFTPSSPIYVIGDSDTSFVLDVPTSGSFPSDPCYIVIRTTPVLGSSAKYRYAFIMTRGTIDEKKVRYTCRFDIWTEHFPELINEQYAISRRHQNRYVDRTAVTKVKIYNGLSDPIPESMVQGRKVVQPIDGLYSQKWTSGKTYLGHIIPIWVYWRLKTNVWYNKHDNVWVKRSVDLEGVDPAKSALPVIARCVGVFVVNQNTPYTSTYYPIDYVLNSSDIQLTGYMGDKQVETFAFSSPYIAQSYVSTIPPFKCSYPKANNNFNVKIEDSFFDTCLVYKNSTDTPTRIGTDDDGALVPIQGTMVGFYGAPNHGHVPSGNYEYATLTTNETTTFDDGYEPKIEESPFENVTFDAFGAELDVSPNPANPKVRVGVTKGAHRDLIFFTGTDEIHRMSGIAPSKTIDAMIETIDQWLVTSAQTHNNAEVWKGWNNLINTGSGMFQGAMTGRTVAAVAPMATGFLGFMQAVETAAAFQKDMRNSPNSANVASESAVDNFPYLDCPVLRKRVLPDGIKQKIMRYWHVYGYPDNRSDTITNSITRESFVYIQATPHAPVRGLLPGQQTDFQTAIASGIWINRIKTATIHEEFGYYYTEIGENKATTTNSEVVVV